MKIPKEVGRKMATLIEDGQPKTDGDAIAFFDLLAEIGAKVTMETFGDRVSKEAMDNMLSEAKDYYRVAYRDFRDSGLSVRESMEATRQAYNEKFGVGQ